MLELRVALRKAFSFPIENNICSRIYVWYVFGKIWIHIKRRFCYICCLGGNILYSRLVNWKRKQTRCRLFEAEIVWGKHFVLQVGKIRCLRVWRVQDWRMWRGGCVVVQMIAALTFCTLLHLRAAVHSAAPRVPPTYHSRPFTGLFCNSYSNIYHCLREERIAVWSISQLPRNFVSLDMVYRQRSI